MADWQQGVVIPEPPEWQKGEEQSPVWKKALRYLNLGSRGITDVLSETATALPELYTAGLRKVGLPAPKEGYFETGLKEGMQGAGDIASSAMGLPTIGTRQPETTSERAVYQGGRGVGGAATIAVPAAAMARATQLGNVARGVAGQLAANPLIQATAGGVGGAVTGATDNPYLGMAASMLTPFGVHAAKRAITPFPNRLTPEQTRLQNVATAENIPISPGQQVGSRAAQTLESVLDDMPFSAGMGEARRQTQQTAFNRSVLRRAGISADVATPDVLDAAARRLGTNFENLSRGTTVQLDRPFERDMAAVSARYLRKLPSQVREVFQAYWDDLSTYTARGQMAGEVYQSTRSDIGRHAKSLVNSDPQLSNALYGIRDALDNAMGRSVAPAARDAWQQVRRQYGALKTIMKAMSASGTGQAEGNISGAGLWNAARAAAASKDQFVRGAGDLNDLARVGQTYVKGQIPNSGTSQRNMLIKMLQGTGPVGTAGAMSGGDPLMMAAAGTLGYSIPPAVQAFLQSPAGRAYMTNQLVANPTGITRGLLSSIGSGQFVSNANRTQR